MKEPYLQNISEIEDRAKKGYPYLSYPERYIFFNNISGIEPRDQETVDVSRMTYLFSTILKMKRPDLLKHTPYLVNICNLEPKNEYTTGDFVAIDKEDYLDLYLNFEKIRAMEEFPVYKLVWVLFHEFRHKVQSTDPVLKSFFDFPNWKNYMGHLIQAGGNPDTLDHVLHELKPTEVDAHIFACEMTGLHFTGTIFDITEESLKKLT